MPTPVFRNRDRALWVLAGQNRASHPLEDAIPDGTNEDDAHESLVRARIRQLLEEGADPGARFPFHLRGRNDSVVVGDWGLLEQVLSHAEPKHWAGRLDILFEAGLPADAFPTGLANLSQLRSFPEAQNAALSQTWRLWSWGAERRDESASKKDLTWMGYAVALVKADWDDGDDAITAVARALAVGIRYGASANGDEGFRAPLELLGHAAVSSASRNERLHRSVAAAARVLLEAGANPDERWQGSTPPECPSTTLRGRLEWFGSKASPDVAHQVAPFHALLEQASLAMAVPESERPRAKPRF